MKILHVITGFGKAAGSSLFCGELCSGLVARGHDVVLAILDPNEPEKYPIDSGVRVVSIFSVFSGEFGFMPDVVHFHVVWLPLMHRLCAWAKRYGVPIVWSPHGTLTPWAMHYKWWKKWPAWWLYQKRDLAASKVLHVTAISEEKDIRRLGLVNRICVVPLGTRLPKLMERDSDVASGRRKTILFVSRVQKKKGLPNLVQAWAALSDDIKRNWRVRIVGPDQEGHVAEVMNLCRASGVLDDFEFIGPKYGHELDEEYFNADLFVLPTFSENFGSVVTEALAHGLPVITTKGTPWEELNLHGCGWWIDIGAEPLSRTLAEAMTFSNAERHKMGLRGRSLVQDKYSWDVVVKMMEKAYGMCV